MKSKKILSLLLALTVMATMLMAVPLTGYAASVSDLKTISETSIFMFGQNGETFDTSNFVSGSESLFYDDEMIIKSTNITSSGSSVTLTNPLTSETVTCERKIYTKGGNSRYIAIKVNTGATVTVYHNTNSNRHMVIDSSASYSGSPYAYANTGTVSYTATADNQLLYIAGYAANSDDTSVPTSSGGDLYVCAITVEYPESEALALDETELSLTADSTATLTASFKNTDASDVTWAVAEGGDEDITVEADDVTNYLTATVRVADTASVGDTATITATAGDLTASCEVTVVSPTKDIVIKGNAGVKSLTLTGTDVDYTATVYWNRSMSSAAVSMNDANGSDYSSSDRGWLRTINDVPIGTYSVTVTGVDEYYTNVTPSVTELTVDSSTEGSSSSPNITVTATKITSTSIDIDYTKVSGTVTYSFNTSTGAANEYISYQNSGTDAPVYSDTYDSDLYMLVDTTTNYSEAVVGSNSGGKFVSTDTYGNIQCNSGTILKIPVIKGSVVTFSNLTVTPYTDNGDGTYTLGDSGQSTVSYDGTSNGWLTVVADGGTWLTQITVTSPEALASPFEDWYLGYNSAGTVGTATVDSDAQTVTIDTLNIYTVLDEPVNNGTVTFSADVSVESGNGFRIYLENENAGNYQDTNNATSGVIAEAVHFAGGTIYTGPELGGANDTGETYTANTWYHIDITIDYSNTSTPINISITDGDGGTVLDTDIAAISGVSTTLNQIRLVRRSVASTWKNLTITTTSAFGDGESDSGKYEDSDTNTVGVIRFLQEYTGAAVSDYGFYFVASDGTILSSNAVISGTEEIDSTSGGFYGDLYGVDLTESRTYYAKAYATIDDITTFGGVITGTVSTDSDDVTYTEPSSDSE